MSSTDIPVSRAAEAPADSVARPRARLSVFQWLRLNLFNGWLNSLITVGLLALLARFLYGVLLWMITDATWAPVWANLRLFWIGRYPGEQVWRVQASMALVLLLFGLSAGLWRGIVRAVTLGLAIAMLALALFPFAAGIRLSFLGMALMIAAAYAVASRLQRPLRWPTIVLWLLSPLIIVLLIRGLEGSTALPLVASGLWGGLMLTLMLTIVGITASFPIGVLLALGRRSSLPAVRAFCVAYIEVIRGVPLITVLFMALVMLPLFLPANIRVDNIVRVIVAITLFSAAYLAENVRGGLQAVPRGQVEAARALGLNIFQTTLLIVLPQALRAVIPAIVGQFISLLKDTSLVSIVGLIELLRVAGIVTQQPQWITVPGGVEREVMLFVAFVYWVFCFSMARVSRRIEANLGVGVR